MKNETKRRLLRARITHISLVNRGAVQVEALYKAEADGSFVVETLLAKSAEEGTITTLVYLPERPDFQGHIAAHDVIKDMAHNFFVEGGGKIDVMHDLQDIEGGAHIAESFIVQKGDPRFEGLKDYDGNPVDPEGSWGVIIKLEDPKLRDLYRSGAFNGVSMFGKGWSTPEQITKQFQDALADRLGQPQEGVFDMDETKFAELMAKALQPVMERLTKLETPEKPTEPVAEKTEIEFEGDPTSAEDLAKHEDKIMLASCDFSKPEDLKKWRDYLAAKEPKAEVKEDPVEKSEELKKAESERDLAEAKVAELRKGSGQSPEDVKKTETAEEVLQKGMNRGKEIAEAHNKRLGR
jgi:hypothetical protein